MQLRLTLLVLVLSSCQVPTDGADLKERLACAYQFVCSLLTLVYQLKGDTGTHMTCQYEPMVEPATNQVTMAESVTGSLTTSDAGLCQGDICDGEDCAIYGKTCEQTSDYCYCL